MCVKHYEMMGEDIKALSKVKVVSQIYKTISCPWEFAGSSFETATAAALTRPPSQLRLALGPVPRPQRLPFRSPQRLPPTRGAAAPAEPPQPLRGAQRDGGERRQRLPAAQCVARAERLRCRQPGCGPVPGRGAGGPGHAGTCGRPFGFEVGRGTPLLGSAWFVVGGLHPPPPVSEGWFNNCLSNVSPRG